jgi:hypothetical protein
MQNKRWPKLVVLVRIGFYADTEILIRAQGLEDQKWYNFTAEKSNYFGRKLQFLFICWHP